MASLIKEYVHDIPIAITREIGHGSDAKAIKIGEKICVSE